MTPFSTAATSSIPLGGTTPHPTSSCVPGRHRAQPWTKEFREEGPVVLAQRVNGALRSRDGEPIQRGFQVA